MTATAVRANKKIRVLVVDDSALVRKLITSMLNEDPDIEVVGAAQDPYVAREKIKELKPDVLTLDVEMPRMDGITFLRNLMRLRPMPVVMVSSLTDQGADVTLQALELGAIDFVTKPKMDLAHSFEGYGEDIREKIKGAAGVELRAMEMTQMRRRMVEQKQTADAVLPQTNGVARFRTTDKLIALGASTGGTEAIREVLCRLDPAMPGMVITQHIPAAFSGPFARRMNDNSALAVCEAEDGQQILPGHAYIAPGDRHLVVERDGARFIIRLHDGPRVNRHKPSVDVMFRSVAQNLGPNAVGVLLTGMGDDGARGLKEMQEAGAPTLAQDEHTSVVWGMPGEAVKRGAADHVLPLQDIAGSLTGIVAAIKN
ncbi:MAG: chemotaxis response regulator protein-glutamate methylesterase [Gammaproteobacteria bacterium]|nr:chemotaxis response regulator protein-glutamate methylesterase [Gammaproteobacteria bacterium]